MAEPLTEVVDSVKKDIRVVFYRVRKAFALLKRIVEFIRKTELKIIQYNTLLTNNLSTVTDSTKILFGAA
jgi:hypothetical protein